MKTVLALALCILSVSVSAQARATANSKCPPVVNDPKKLVCVTKMNYVGQKFAAPLVIELKSDDGSNPTGSTEFAYPGLSGGALNSIKATVFTETHGNSPTCQQSQTFEIEMNVLGYKLAGLGRKSVVKIDDGFGFNTFDLEMSCSAR